jgi:hypothetical protein
VAAGKFADNAGNQNLDTYSGAAGTVAVQVVEANNLLTIAYNTLANPNPPAYWCPGTNAPSTCLVSTPRPYPTLTPSEPNPISI